MKWRHTTRGTTIPSKVISASENAELNEDDERFTTSSSEGEDGEIDVVTDNWLWGKIKKMANVIKLRFYKIFNRIWTCRYQLTAHSKYLTCIYNSASRRLFGKQFFLKTKQNHSRDLNQAETFSETFLGGWKPFPCVTFISTPLDLLFQTNFCL